MQKIKVIFTDSGLGGLSIMADFVKLADLQGLNVDSVFFNAQHSRDWGYKKMNSKTQVLVFNKALQSIQDLYNPDIIAIACNTLSVVYLKSDFYKQAGCTVLDIIETGKSLVKYSDCKNILEIAMPTTIESGVYLDENKEVVGVASDITLPDAIENADYQKIDFILKEVFKQARLEMIKRSLQNSDVALFLACTHFPVIKDKFIKIAKAKGVDICTILNPNEKFSQLVIEEVLMRSAIATDNKKPKNKVTVISRLKFKESEITNFANLIKTRSAIIAEALKNYEYHPDLF